MTTTPQAISRILNAAGITKSKWGRGRICMMASEGYEVANKFGLIIVNYRNRTSSMLSYDEFQPKREAEMAKIKEVLTAKGYQVEAVSNEFIVRKVNA